MKKMAVPRSLPEELFTRWPNFFGVRSGDARHSHANPLPSVILRSAATKNLLWIFLSRSEKLDAKSRCFTLFSMTQKQTRKRDMF
jgi:hypothetical protein